MSAQKIIYAVILPRPSLFRALRLATCAILAVYISRNFFFILQQEKFSLALGKFTRMVSLVESLSDERDLKQVHVSSLILAGHLNVALCYLKLGKYMECIESCDKVICETLNSNT